MGNYIRWRRKMPKFSDSSKKRLATCHDDLQRLFNDVIQYTDCTVLDGHRDQAAQDDAFINGYSKVEWPDSNHNVLPSMAVDVVPYPIDWDNIERFKRFASYVKKTADEMCIEVRWGGDFKTYFDGPHYELVE